MQFTINSKIMASHCLDVIRAINGNVILPICETIRIYEENGCLNFQATNMSITAHLFDDSVDVPNGLNVCINAKTFTDLLKALPNEPVIFKHEGNMVHLTGAKSKYEFSTYDAEDFPVPPSLDGDTSQFTILASTIKTLIPYCSTDELRSNLNGISFKISEGAIAASDSVSLMSVRVDKQDAPDVFLPLNAAKVVSQLEGELTVMASKGGKHVSFQSGNLTYTCLVSEANFPNITPVLDDTNHDKKIAYSKAELTQSVKRARMASDAASNTISLSIADDKCNVSSVGGDDISGQEVVQCDLEGDAIDISLNAIATVAVLNSFKEVHETLLRVSNDRVIIHGKANDGNDATALLMPVFAQ